MTEHGHDPGEAAAQATRALHRAIPCDGTFAIGEGGLHVARVEGLPPSRALVAQVAASGPSASPSTIELWIDGAVESCLSAFVGYGGVVHVGVWCRETRRWTSREMALVADVASVAAGLPSRSAGTRAVTGDPSAEPMSLDRISAVSRRAPGPRVSSRRSR